MDCLLIAHFGAGLSLAYAVYVAAGGSWPFR
jgi:hypothetical protein